MKIKKLEIKKMEKKSLRKNPKCLLIDPVLSLTGLHFTAGKLRLRDAEGPVGPCAPGVE